MCKICFSSASSGCFSVFRMAVSKIWLVANESQFIVDQPLTRKFGAYNLILPQCHVGRPQRAADAS